MRTLHECSVCHTIFVNPWDAEKCETQPMRFRVGDWLEEFDRYGQVVHLIPNGGHQVLPICSVLMSPGIEERKARYDEAGKINDLWWFFPYGSLMNHPPQGGEIEQPPAELIERLVKTYGQVVEKDTGAISALLGRANVNTRGNELQRLSHENKSLKTAITLEIPTLEAHNCTCPRSWPRAGNHSEECLFEVVKRFRAALKG